MSVLIKGLKMPQNCDACPMLYEYRFCALTDDHASSIEWKIEEKRMPNCPLIELPDHGDLVDRDELYVNTMDYCDLEEKIWNTPAVIPAEKSEESLCICDNCDQRNDKGCSVCKYIINERSEDGEN